MFRSIFSVICRTSSFSIANNSINRLSLSVIPKLKCNYSGFLFQHKNVSTLIKTYSPIQHGIQKIDSSLLQNKFVPPIVIPDRNVCRYSLKKGKRKSVKAVIDRFYRLHWGIWIRTKAGRFRRRWTKSDANAVRARQHVFCNGTQSKMLDKMVWKYWQKRRYYIDDPYEPYHKREEFFLTRKKPMHR